MRQDMLAQCQVEMRGVGLTFRGQAVEWSVKGRLLQAKHALRLLPHPTGRQVVCRRPVEPELVTVAGDAALVGGCVLCDNPDFLRGGFGERTMIICDQCEREFHIGCLAQHNRAHLTELPEGKRLPPDLCSTIFPHPCWPSTEFHKLLESLPVLSVHMRSADYLLLH